MRENENIALLRRMEEDESRARRRAALMAWMLVGLAVVVLAVMLATGARRLSDIRAQTAVESEKLEQLRAELRVLEDSLRTQNLLVGNYRTLITADIANLPAVAQVPIIDGPRQSFLIAEDSAEPGTELPESPTLVPMIERSRPTRPASAERADSVVVRRPPARVFMQIVTSDDRAHADTVGARLAAAGFLMLGVEHVTRAPRLRTTEVRYYRKDDEAGAQQLLLALRAAGEPDAVLLYLGLENNPRVRRRQYEIWFAAGAGERAGA